MTTPDSDSSTPTIAPISTRGRRTFHIISKRVPPVSVSMSPSCMCVSL